MTINGPIPKPTVVPWVQYKSLSKQQTVLLSTKVVEIVGKWAIWRNAVIINQQTTSMLSISGGCRFIRWAGHN